MFLKSKNTKDTVHAGKKKSAAYIVIAISMVLIIVAIYLITSNEFWYCVRNIDYYASQYEYTSSMSSGYFGGDYRFLASKWKNLYDDALITIVYHILGAVVLSVVGGIGIYKGIKNSKKNNVSIKDDNMVE